MSTDTEPITEVCYHSGLPQHMCDYACQHCRTSYVPTPDPAEILRRAAAIRQNWTEEGEMARRGIHQTTVYIQRAVMVTDHRCRRKEAGFR